MSLSKFIDNIKPNNGTIFKNQVSIGIMFNFNLFIGSITPNYLAMLSGFILQLKFQQQGVMLSMPLWPLLVTNFIFHAKILALKNICA